LTVMALADMSTEKRNANQIRTLRNAFFHMTAVNDCLEIAALTIA